MGSFKKIVVFVVLYTFFVQISYAGWLDTWYQNTSVNNPGIFQLQDRGILVGGGFTSKTKLRTDNLFSIEPPKLKVGCGGIDIFLGSFSFLNPSYLIEKAKRIIQAAPYFAFDLALSILCHECAAIMKAIQGIIDKLNGLQLDECKASKALVAIGAEAIANPNGVLNEVSSAISKGASSLFNDVRLEKQENAGSSWKERLDEYFTTNFSNYVGGNSGSPTQGGQSLLGKKLMDCLKRNKHCSLISAYYDAHPNANDVIDQNILRGFIGDISVDVNTKSREVRYLQVQPINSNIFLNGSGSDIQACPGKLPKALFNNGALKKECDNSYISITKFVEDGLEGLKQYYLNYKDRPYTISGNAKNLIERTSVPVAAFMRIKLIKQYVSGTKDIHNELKSITEGLKEYIKNELALKMLEDIYSIVNAMSIEIANASITAFATTEENDDFVNKLQKAIEKMTNIVSEHYFEVRKEFLSSLNNKAEDYRQIFEQYNLEKFAAIQLLSSVFGKSLTSVSFAGKL